MKKKDGYALVNHILKNISLPVGMHTYSNCKNRCMMEDRCKSINMGPKDKDKVLCQISDSDHVQHPSDLKPTDGFTYRGMEVRTRSSVLSLQIYFLFCKSSQKDSQNRNVFSEWNLRIKIVEIK